MGGNGRAFFHAQLTIQYAARTLAFISDPTIRLVNTVSRAAARRMNPSSPYLAKALTWASL